MVGEGHGGREAMQSRHLGRGEVTELQRRQGLDRQLVGVDNLVVLPYGEVQRFLKGVVGRYVASCGEICGIWGDMWDKGRYEGGGDMWARWTRTTSPQARRDPVPLKYLPYDCAEVEA